MKPLILAMSVVLAASARPACQEQPRGSALPADAAGLIAQLESIERSLQSLELELSCHVERGTEDAPEPSGEIVLQVWREASPDGRVRMTAAPEIWPSASGRMIETWSTHAYDGLYGYSLDDERDPVPTGQILAGRPPILKAWSAFTGWAATVHGNAEEQGARLSELLASIGPSLRVERSDDRVVATAQSADTLRRWFFESRAGLVLVRHEQQRDSVLLREMEADRFIEAAPGIPFPTEVVDTVRAESGERLVRRVIHCRRAVANAPDFDASRFVIDFAPGTPVLDHVHERQLTIGPKSGELGELIDDRLRTARSDSSSGPAWPWWAAGLLGLSLALWRFRTRRSSGERRER